jgi:hypothetical protein
MVQGRVKMPPLPRRLYGVLLKVPRVTKNIEALLFGRNGRQQITEDTMVEIPGAMNVARRMSIAVAASNYHRELGQSWRKRCGWLGSQTQLRKGPILCS